MNPVVKITAAATLAFAAGVGTTVLQNSSTQTALPTVGSVALEHHDASGRVQTASATLNSFSYNGGQVSLTYTSDQLFCSPFSP